jgi:histidinol-phosphate aminotransferase
MNSMNSMNTTGTTGTTGTTTDDARQARLALARAAYRDIPVYAPHGPGENPPAVVIDASDNTNLWGPPPAAARALREAPGDVVSRYPALYAHELRRLLSGYAGVSPDELVIGCGSDDILDSAMRAFAEPGDAVALPVPSFSMISTFARMNVLRPIGVPLTGDWDADADGLLATGAKVIYLCSPNNPTGTVTSEAAIRRVVAEAPGLVILDEAYAEFADVSHVADAPGWERVLVTRTMSKAWGLAGLRVGYGTGAAWLVREVEKARGPYMVNAMAQRAVETALRDDVAWMRERAREAVENRERLRAALRALGLDVLPSAANFVLARSPRARELAAALQREGILVRLFAGLPLVGDALRIGVGPWTQMQQVLDALARAEGSGR